MKNMIRAWALLAAPVAVLHADSVTVSIADDLQDDSVDIVESDTQVNQDLIDTINGIIDTLGLRDWYDNAASDDDRAQLIALIFALLQTTQDLASQYGDIFQQIQDLTQVDIQEFTATLRFTPASSVA